jgi:hypothetical protein
MLANTKEVRRILRAFNISANYTEKTVRKKTGRAQGSTRIVMASIGYKPELFENVKQAFADVGYTNKVYYTDYCYLRVKTFIA